MMLFHCACTYVIPHPSRLMVFPSHADCEVIGQSARAGVTYKFLALSLVPFSMAALQCAGLGLRSVANSRINPEQISFVRARRVTSRQEGRRGTTAPVMRFNQRVPRWLIVPSRDDHIGANKLRDSTQMRTKYKEFMLLTNRLEPFVKLSKRIVTT